MRSMSPGVGVVTFADARKDQAAASAAWQYLEEQHGQLVDHLVGQGFRVIDPNRQVGQAAGKGFLPVTTSEQRDLVASALQLAGVDCLIIGSWRWSEPMPVVDLVRRLDVPTVLYGRTDADWSGIGGITAYGAGLWEVAPNRSALVHARIRDELPELVRWLRGVGAYGRLRRANLLIWGGMGCQGMDHVLDDLSRLKAFLVDDIMVEGQYYLIRRAEALLSEGKAVQPFLEWLSQGGVHICRDEKMVTSTSLAREAALYLAAEERLAELGHERVDGVSLLCQKELITEYGVSPCMIPAFLPFGWNHLGPKPATPTVCEGDVKGLITSLLLQYLEPGVPAFFGDIREIKGHRNWIVIANCGGGAVYYAANSNDPAQVLPELRLEPQIHGVSGAAVNFYGKGGIATLARLVRVQGQYFMHVGLGQRVPVTEEIQATRKWGKEWPTVIIDMGVSADAFSTVAGSNHYNLIPGDHVRELEYACRQAGIPVLRVDSAQGITEALDCMTARQAARPWNPAE